MNLYIILTRFGEGWTPCFTLFESRAAAEAFARVHYQEPGREWRLVLIPAVLMEPRDA